MSGTVYLNISRYTCDAFLLLHQLSNTLFLGGGAASAPYGSSQARGPIGATAAEPTPQPQQCQIPALSLTYTTAHGNVRSLTHWVRPRIKPKSSWILVGFVTTEPQWELHPTCIFKMVPMMFQYLLPPFVPKKNLIIQSRFYFFWPHPWHAEISRPGIEQEWPQPLQWQTPDA